ncbi:response regulator [Rhodopseudomonas telluris]|uniref:Response regulator n=1 Tax=Rhodopseudomonas telluris TaxID=644215 RepID=A0ABV6ETV0_9BRAD
MRSRILHIDDDPAMLKIVAAVLSVDPTLETKGCLSGEEGVRAAAEWLPDLILSDVSMPGVNGFELLERLRNRASTMGIPVVFTTSRSRLDHIEQFVSRGVSGVIAKPFNLRELVSNVRRYLDLAVADQGNVELPEISIDRRLQDDKSSLREFRCAFVAGDTSVPMRDVVHKLVGVAGLYGYEAISEAAACLERELDSFARGLATRTDVLFRLDALLGQLDRDTATRAE